MNPIPLINRYDANKRIAIDRTRSWSQGEFLAAAQGLAQGLSDAPYLVNLCRNRFNFMLGFAAGLIRGKTTLLPPSSLEDTVAGIVRAYPGTLVLTDTDEHFSQLQATDIRGLIDTSAAAAPSVPAFDAHQPVAIAFTSGSTGTPQPHLKDWGTLAITAQLLGQRFMPGQDETIVATVPSQHMYGLEMTILMALQSGATLYTGQPFYPKDIQSAVSLAARTLLVSTPVHLRAALGGQLRYPALAGVVSATAPLADTLAQQVETGLQCAVKEIYGCTEGGSIATRRTLDGPTWSLLDTMTLHAQDDAVILNAPHLPPDIRLEDSLLLTAAGFELLGRNADMLNVAGKRFSLGELTTRLLEIEGVDDAVAFLPDAKDDIERPVAFVVSQLAPREIARQLARKVDAAFIPRPIISIAQIPRNATGKVQRATLIELYEQLEP